MKKTIIGMICLLAAVAVGADEFSEVDAGASSWYAGASAGALMPGGGNSLDRAAAISARAGRYFSDYCALELEGMAAPNAVCGHGGNTAVSGVTLDGVFHFAGWETFDRLFGCERFDPFATIGAGAVFAGKHVFADDSHRTALGPVFGLGAFYHLTDSLSLRGDARAMVCCDTPAGVVFSAAIGIQYSFGGGE